MAKIIPVPALVSYRNHFEPAGELVDDALLTLPDQFKHENFQKWLTLYTEKVIKSVASHFGLGAQRGIEQVAEILCDPKFYEKRRERRKKNRQRFAEYRAKQEWEHIEAQLNPTEDQIQSQVKWSEDKIKYHQGQLTQHEQNLLRLKSISPRNIKFESKSVQ